MAESTVPAADAPIEALLARIGGQGAARFDPAGWHYLETLARRAALHEGSAAGMLQARLEQRAASFAARFAQARVAAGERLAEMAGHYPQSAGALQQLFATGDFKGLRRMQATLAAREQCAALASLVAQLDTEPSAVPALASPNHAPAAAPASSARPRELRTVRESRATWARLSVDRQLAQARQQGPANAGPINSHMLVLRSLTMMQEISPAYLNHMVSYVDALLALDPGEAVVPVKRKKGAPAKSARPAKARAAGR